MTPAIKGSVGKLKSTELLKPISFRVTARGVQNTINRVSFSNEKNARKTTSKTNGKAEKRTWFWGWLTTR